MTTQASAEALPPQQTAPSTALVDRLVGATGGRSFVRGRPGAGWLAAEVVPAAIWIHITGALSLEYVYLVAFLVLLGAQDTHLSLLPTMAFAANLLMALRMARRPSGDAKQTCVRDTLWGRVLWLLTVLWPFSAWWAGMPTSWVIGGALVAVFAGQFVHMLGASAFITWTQALIPREQRGAFFAWRQIASFVAVAAVLQIAGIVLPQRQLDDPALIPWLAALLGGATIIGILGVLPLARAPAMPAAPAPVRTRPLLAQAIGDPNLRRHLAWSALVAMAMAASLGFQPKLFTAAGVSVDAFARLQALAQTPAMLAGILLASWSLRRLHARITLLIAQIVLVAGEMLLLALAPQREAVLVVALITLGLGKGAISIAWMGRVQELVPPGDPRFPALIIGIGGAAGLCAGLLLPVMLPALDGLAQAWALTAGSAWLLVALGVALRLLALPLLLRPDRMPAR